MQKAVTRKEHYIDYMLNGGELEKLPKPVTREEEALYKMCIRGVGLPSRGAGYYRCILNSGAAAQNYVSFILDLGTERVSTVKVKAKVIVKGTSGTELPKNLGLRLFANDNSALQDISLYQHRSDTLITNGLTANSEHILEFEFPNQGANTGETAAQNTLNKFRYLKPYIVITKTTPQNTIKTAIDVHELNVEVNGVEYDITDTISDYGETVESNITYIRNIKP